MGEINTYPLFAELALNIMNEEGRVGIILPSGIATDDTTKFFFRDLMDTRTLASLYDFENRRGIFPGVHRSYKFCLLTLTGNGRPQGQGAELAFFLQQVTDLKDGARLFVLSRDDIALLNPNTRTCPIFRSQRDAEITKAIYRRVPVLIKDGPPEENPWGVQLRQGLFSMANDSHLFRTCIQLEAEGWRLVGNIFRRGEEVYLPLYEAKMMHYFDHRWATYEGTDTRDITLSEKGNPDFLALSRYWVPEGEVKQRVPRRPEMLASALAVPENHRGKVVRKALCYWAAGYWRKMGDEEKVETLLAAALPSYITDTQADVLNKWALGMKCEEMQERFPLTEADVNRMAQGILTAPTPGPAQKP